MPPENNDDAKVEYSVKELLKDVVIKLDRISDKMDKKADVSELRAFQERVFTLEGRMDILAAWRQEEMANTAQQDLDLDTLKSRDTADEAVSRYKRWLWGAIGLNIAEGVIAIFARRLHF